MNSNNPIHLNEQLRQLIEWLNVIVLGGENDGFWHNGVFKPSNEKSFADRFGALQAMVNGRVAFETKAQLVAAGAPPADKPLAEVWRDGVRENNGLYGWNGVAWEKSPYDNTDALKADLNKATNIMALGVRESLGKFEKTGVVGGDDHQIDVVSHADLPLDDKVLGAVTDELGNMLEGWNQLGQKVVTVDVRLLKALMLKNAELLSGEFNYANAVTDENGHVAFGVETDSGKTLAALLKVFGGIEVGEQAQIQSGEFNYDFALVDENGHVGFGIMAGRIVSGHGIDTHNLTERDNANIARSAQLKSQVNPYPAQNVFDYNHLVVYGQSLSTGMEGWPRLSKVAQYGNLMLGDAVRPKSISGAGFDPVGDVAELKPLVACVQDSGSGAVISDAEVALLPSGHGASGETPSEGWANMAKWLHNRHRHHLNDDQHLFVATNNGVPGRTIEALSKGASPELYQRFTDCLTHISTLAQAAGKTYGVTGICWMQGEWNYTTNHGGDDTRDGYLAKLKTLRTDMLTDIKAVTGQQDDPAFLTYQTGAAYTRDDKELAIGMAQWDFTRDVPNTYMVGPAYPYTDKGGHLDSNGYRWFGNQIAKVYHRVVTLGQYWKPLSPVRSALDGKKLVIDFHVPEPPLQFGTPYVATSEADYADKGFRVSDDDGDVAITAVRIVGQTLIEITLVREPVANAKLWYADKTRHNGNGNVMDSDASVAHDPYQYHDGSGQYPSANLPHLNDKPYPLNNWLIAFCIPVNWSE